MLDLKTGEHLLDLCSGPGGKSLTAMQTLKLGRIVCNDNAGNRTRRVSHVMNAYLFDDFNPQMGRDVIQYSVRDGQKCPEVFEEQFDKVLCDVPCFTDRNVIFNEEGNVFHPTRVKERLRMPELQSQLLQ
jgi:16S rRNA C967 or C1407 C5-methylase (RsmB/RsmF family)